MVVPDEIYDDWLPLLGAMTIGVYTAICWLSERQETVRVKDLAICLVHNQTLALICRKLAACGLVELGDPVAQGNTVITLLLLPAVATAGEAVWFAGARLLPETEGE